MSGALLGAIGIIFVVLVKLFRKLCDTSKFSEAEVSKFCVLVTGCDNGGGFGDSIVQKLVQAGFRVFAGCYSTGGMERVTRDDVSGRVTPVQLDVTSDQSVQSCISFIQSEMAKLGDFRLWACVNNAGAHDGCLVDWTSMDQFEKLMHVNFFGVVRMSKATLPLLKNSKGRLINLTSMDGLRPMPGIAAYTSSKHAADAFTRSLAMEMRSFGVSAIVVNPGTFNTPLLRSGSSSICRTFESAPDDIKLQYGEDYLRRLETYVRKFASQSAKDTSPVGDAVRDAIMATWPSHRYVVGVDARYFWKPLRDWMPEFVIDNIVAWVLNTALPLRL
eukprot:TRINITY_DN40549_c0_g1_i1.p1 TRINITY_DN40549_c0_g1~~TRINITY_DN40549_c0_g1_i1.p1  ORF type:complete len:357 (-),score=36.79 TRINITY_DN40549_c0_g1_i1:35-1027(-)